MKTTSKFLWNTLAVVLFTAIGMRAATEPHYLITNNDDSIGNSATFYSFSGTLLFQTKVVKTGGTGIDGIGSVATKRVSIMHSPSESCVYISDAGTNDVAGISISTLTPSGTFKGSSTDNGSSSGIGIVNNGTYLYANFTGSQTLATFQILPNCELNFVQDVAAKGLSGGTIIDMAVHADILVASFADGSIGSFNIAGGVPVSNDDSNCQPAMFRTEAFPLAWISMPPGTLRSSAAPLALRSWKSPTFPQASLRPQSFTRTWAAARDRKPSG